MWEGRKALVTGGAGFIGAHIVKALLERGAEVFVLDRKFGPRATISLFGLEGQVTKIEGDVREEAFVLEVLASCSITEVFHLAAFSVVGEALGVPSVAFEVNVKGTWAVLEAARRYGGCEAVLVASSDKAYGEQESLPYTEEMALLGSDPYSASKACADIVARGYAITYGLPVVVVRASNAYGEGDVNMSRLVPSVVATALRGERPVLRSDGRPLRDYVYVEDLAEAYLLLAQRAREEGLRGEAFNVGSGRPISVLEITKALLRAAGREDLEPVILGGAKGEIRRQFVDITKIGERVGWRPKTSLPEGLRRTVEWYRENLERLPKIRS